MSILIRPEMATAKAVLAFQTSSELVALCEVKCDTTIPSNSLEILSQLGVFPVPLTSLRLVIRSVENNQKGAIYDVKSLINLPKSQLSKISTCALGEGDFLVVPEDVLTKTLSSQQFSLRVATLGHVDATSNKKQHHAIFYDALNNKFIVGGNLKNLASLAKAAFTVVAKQPIASIVVFFGSTIAEASLGNNQLLSTRSSEVATLSTLVYLHNTFEALYNHLSTIAGHTVAEVPKGDRYLVRVSNIEFPLLVPCDDSVHRKAIHNALCLPLRIALLTADKSTHQLRMDKGPTSVLDNVPVTFAEFMSLSSNPNMTKISLSTGEPAGALQLVLQPKENSGPSPPLKGATKIDLGSLKMPKTIPNASTHIISTPLVYYHYRLDGFNDEGWGCAYRSLQLVLSWFQQNGIMKKPMPSVLEIQKLLSIIDPEKANKNGFVGSKEWIGSFEVMMVLQHYVEGLECTIQRMESGKELDNSPAIHRLLATHFERGGCPVMIGGSAYAHTIVGIDVNIRTSQAQYLIVDPHYPSTAPDAATVVQKGWVGWKDASKFFNQSSWYNMCVPRVYDMDFS